MEIYECVVVDNTCFWKNGRIKVRINKTGDGLQDFSIDPKFSRNFNKEKIGENDDDNLEGDGVIDHDDFAELSTCMGGAFDAGVFYLPQPNTKGLVTSIYTAGATKPRYVWIGALIPTYPENPVLRPIDKNDYIETINIPSDSLDNKNGFNNQTANFVKPENKNHAIVFKQKETYWSKNDESEAQDLIKDEEETKKSISWAEAPTLNMAVIDKSRTFIVHNMYDKDDNYLGQAHISIDNEEGVSIKFEKSTDNENYEASMEILTNGTASLTSNYNDKIINKFEATTEELTILHKEEKVEGSISLSKGIGSGDHILSLSLTQNNKTENIELKKGMINLNTSGDITLNTGNNGSIFIGGGSGTNYLLSYPSNGIAGSGAISNFEASSVVACTKIRV